MFFYLHLNLLYEKSLTFILRYNITSSNRFNGMKLCVWFLNLLFVWIGDLSALNKKEQHLRPPVLGERGGFLLQEVQEDLEQRLPFALQAAPGLGARRTEKAFPRAPHLFGGLGGLGRLGLGFGLDFDGE